LGDGGDEQLTIILESLLPDPQHALDRLLADKASKGAKLVAHWRLSAKDVGSGAHEVRFEPVAPGGSDPSLLAAGSSGNKRVEVVLGLAHATPSEDDGLRQAMKRASPFRVIVLSHEVDPR